MLEYMPYIWAAVLIAAIIIETQTMDMVTIWFMPSALIAMILGMLKVNVWVQCLVFIMLTAVLLILSRTVFRSVFRKKDTEATNAQALIGKEAVMIEDASDPHSVGTAKINGLLWSVLAQDENEVLKAGDIVIVQEIKGVKLICSKKKS